MCLRQSNRQVRGEISDVGEGFQQSVMKKKRRAGNSRSTQPAGGWRGREEGKKVSEFAEVKSSHFHLAFQPASHRVLEVEKVSGEEPFEY